MTTTQGKANGYVLHNSVAPPIQAGNRPYGSDNSPPMVVPSIDPKAKPGENMAKTFARFSRLQISEAWIFPMTPIGFSPTRRQPITTTHELT